MKKAVPSQCWSGSAEQVVAHARWQRSRGRKPSMSFLNQRNPREALKLASSVLRGVMRSESVSFIGATVLGKKTYAAMNDDEIGAAVRHIVTSSSSEDEVRRRVREELGYTGSLRLQTSIPTDDAGRKERELLRGLGCLVTRGGAIAHVLIRGHEDTICV